MPSGPNIDENAENLEPNILGFSMPNFDGPSMPDAIRRIADSGDRHLAWQFFVFFSRFEYALKRCSQYLTPAAQPNWDRFASANNAEFMRQSLPELLAAIDYFKKLPPQKQVQVDGQLTWSAPSFYDGRNSLLVWLLTAVRGVRNNLFHGGKFPGFPIREPSRDRDLVGNAIVILNACLELDPSVKSKFLEGIED